MDCLTNIIIALIGSNIRLENRLMREIQNNITHRPMLIPINDIRDFNLEEVRSGKMITLKEK